MCLYRASGLRHVQGLRRSLLQTFVGGVDGAKQLVELRRILDGPGVLQR